MRKKCEKINPMNECDMYMCFWYEAVGCFDSLLVGTRFVVVCGLGVLVGNGFFVMRFLS
jgi:hypothetical protein